MKKHTILKAAAALFVSVLSIKNAAAQSYLQNGVVGNQSGPAAAVAFSVAPGGVDGPYIQLYGNQNSDAFKSGSFAFVSGYNSSGTSASHIFYSRTSNGNYSTTLQILQNGQVKIGQMPAPSIHGDYKLAVAGKIVGQSLYITSPSTWSDYVFSPSYRLLPLQDLSAYISTNQHLPGIGSAPEAMKSGYDVSEMNAQLLQKVEELTLYVIQLNEKIALIEKKYK